jgi:hypothetical protein
MRELDDDAVEWISRCLQCAIAATLAADDAIAKKLPDLPKAVKVARDCAHAAAVALEAEGPGALEQAMHRCRMCIDDYAFLATRPTAPKPAGWGKGWEKPAGTSEGGFGDGYAWRRQVPEV